jgi:hypothetical protein
MSSRSNGNLLKDLDVLFPMFIPVGSEYVQKHVLVMGKPVPIPATHASGDPLLFRKPGQLLRCAAPATPAYRP